MSSCRLLLCLTWRSHQNHKKDWLPTSNHSKRFVKVETTPLINKSNHPNINNNVYYLIKVNRPCGELSLHFCHHVHSSSHCLAASTCWVCSVSSGTFTVSLKKKVISARRLLMLHIVIHVKMKIGHVKTWWICYIMGVRFPLI